MTNLGNWAGEVDRMAFDCMWTDGVVPQFYSEFCYGNRQVVCVCD